MAGIDEIIEPLQAVPFNKFHVIQKDPDMRNKIKYHTTVYKYIRKLPIYPAAIDRRWRKGKDEDEIENKVEGEKHESIEELCNC